MRDSLKRKLSEIATSLGIGQTNDTGQPLKSPAGPSAGTYIVRLCPEINRRPSMKGLYATRTIPEGTELFTINGPRVTYNVLQLQKNQFDVSHYAFATKDGKNVCVVLDPQGKPLNEDIPWVFMNEVGSVDGSTFYNEHTQHFELRANTKPNVVHIDGRFFTIAEVLAGEELTLYYGTGYDRTIYDFHNLQDENPYVTIIGTYEARPYDDLYLKTFKPTARSRSLPKVTICKDDSCYIDPQKNYKEAEIRTKLWRKIPDGYNSGKKMIPEKVYLSTKKVKFIAR